MQRFELSSMYADVLFPSRVGGSLKRITLSFLARLPYKLDCPVPEGDGTTVPGGRRIPAVDFRASSTRPLDRLIPGTTHSLQLHCIPCQAYLPTLV